jgi:5-(carboxyamino)imidazole ribonucleotide synthase
MGRGSAIGVGVTPPATCAGWPGGQPTLGILGGGQLGRMLVSAATNLGVRARVLTDHAQSSAAQVCPEVVVADWNDAPAVIDFASGCDVVTVEHEWVEPAVLAQVAEAGVQLRPGVTGLVALSDKEQQRRLLASLDIATPPHQVARDGRAITDAIVAFGPSVVKACRGGYDGRGVVVVDRVVGDEPLMFDVDPTKPWLVEPRLSIDIELAVQVVRAPDGSSRTYPVVETEQVDGMCRTVLVPAAADPAMLRHAEAHAIRIAEAVDYVGVLAVELFVVDGDLLVNEMAPRVHNTGHHTIESCTASQFENHVRAVLGLPLAPTSLVVDAAVMANLVSDRGAPLDLARATIPPGVRVHLYGKTDRPGRKVGHVTALGDDRTELHRTAARVTKSLMGSEQALAGAKASTQDAAR